MPNPPTLQRPEPRLVQEPPPLGGLCADAPEWLFHPVRRQIGAVASHVCLRHCPVLQECRRYAGQYTWLYAVVAGQHWVYRKRDQAAVVSTEPPTGVGCAICAGRPWRATPAQMPRRRSDGTPQPGHRRPPRGSTLRELEGERIRHLYVDLQWPVKRVAQEVGCSKQWCGRILRGLGVQMRPGRRGRYASAAASVDEIEVAERG